MCVSFTTVTYAQQDSLLKKNYLEMKKAIKKQVDCTGKLDYNYYDFIALEKHHEKDSVAISLITNVNSNESISSLKKQLKEHKICSKIKTTNRDGEKILTVNGGYLNHQLVYAFEKIVQIKSYANKKALKKWKPEYNCYEGPPLNLYYVSSRLLHCYNKYLLVSNGIILLY